MGVKKITCLLGLIATIMLVGAWSILESPSAPVDDFRFRAEELEDRSLWIQVNSKPYYISAALDALCRAPTAANYEAERKKNPHAATYITVYVNNAGREAMFSKDASFPEGSIIVKKKVGNSSAGPTTLLYTLMRKRERGYNPLVGDWEFRVVSGDGKQLEASGKIENCQGCHVRKRDSDFVFRPYLKAE